ncbi:MAG: alpha/beta hydrolase [Candidatus Planktophila sp.]
MTEPIRPSTVLPALRTPFTLTTSDGQTLIGEVAAPLTNPATALLCLHPNPTGGGMMDSHLYKKAANRLPDMAGVTVIRFNTRGTTSEAGTSTGEYDGGVAEKYDVQAAIDYCFGVLNVSELWIVGWSFGTEIALLHAHDKRVKGLILLSPPLMKVEEKDLLFWAEDGRPITALVPEHDDYLKPEEARKRFAVIPQIDLIAVDGAKHLWVGEPYVHRVLSEIVRIIAPSRLPLPTELN